MEYAGRSQQKMSEETFDFVCSTCARDNKTKEAVKYCVECSAYFCRGCIEAHMRFPALSGHDLVEVDRANQAMGRRSSLPEFPTEQCNIHKGKVVDMYCEYHDVVGCYVCFAKDHKSCQDSHIHTVTDIIDAMHEILDSKKTLNCLQDNLVAMEELSKAKDKRLEELNITKNQIIEKVTIFETTLQTIVSKLAEDTKKKIEENYQALENDCKKEKHIIDNIIDDFKDFNDKLKNSERNRAQRFVSMKIAEMKIKEADKEKMVHDLEHTKHVMLGFIPNQSLVEHMNALDGIGQIHSHGNQSQGKRKQALYKLKRSREISLKMPDDYYQCSCFGCCITGNNQMLVTDRDNMSLKRVDVLNMTIIDTCYLASKPYAVCSISGNEAAVACRNENIQIIAINETMTVTRRIEVTHFCYGIAYKDDRLYVTDNKDGLHVYDMDGILINTVSRNCEGNSLFTNGRHIAFNENGNKMFIGGGRNNGLMCFDGMCNYISTIKDDDLKYVDGVSADGSGNIFVVGCGSHTVVQFNENNEKVGVVLNEENGLQHSSSVCFHPGLKRMFVTMRFTDVLKVYDVE